nr:hypothetical protein [Tanacetum cinerariifolium]
MLEGDFSKESEYKVYVDDCSLTRTIMSAPKEVKDVENNKDSKKFELKDIEEHMDELAQVKNGVVLNLVKVSPRPVMESQVPTQRTLWKI